jgi:serine protease AprX
MALDNEKLHRLLYQTDGQRRFTQDSPVQADVWERFLLLGEEWQKRRRSSGRPVRHPRVGLLLTPKLTRGPLGEAPGSAALLAEVLRRRVLRIEGDKPRAETVEPTENAALAPLRIAATEQYVAVDLTFHEMIELLMPLTDWWWRPENAELRTRETGADGWPRRPEAKRFVQILTLTAWLLSDEQLPEDAIDKAYATLVPAAQDEFTEFGDQVPSGGEATSDFPLQQKIRMMLAEQWPNLQDGWAAADALTRRTGPAEQTPAVPRIWSISRNVRAVQGSIGPGFQAQQTVKADAARRLFNITTANLTWAIVDSGIDQDHRAFSLVQDSRPSTEIKLADGEQMRSRVLGRYDFTKLRRLLAEAPGNKALSDAERASLLSLRRRNISGRPLDWALLEPLIRVETPPRPAQAHGTHVAGILAGNLPDGPTKTDPENGFIGVCPDLRLLDLKVFPEPGEENAEPGDGFAIIAALEYLDWLNRDRAKPIVHGVNLSVSVPHRVDAHACGRTPVCQAAERLVNNGTVVVAAAGNAGFDPGLGNISLGNGYHDVSITDPGNAEAVITVGSTHRSEPHTYGVSYFSSRGPTGDGRRKPDLVAPGEKILSAVPGNEVQLDDGTSMAAPQVSGVAALLMARHPELIGQPKRIKEILMNTATDLGRDRDFQGAGLVDALRALQSL